MQPTNEQFNAVRIRWAPPSSDPVLRGTRGGYTKDGYSVVLWVAKGSPLRRKACRWTASVEFNGVQLLNARGEGSNQTRAEEAAMYRIRDTIARHRIS